MLVAKYSRSTGSIVALTWTNLNDQPGTPSGTRRRFYRTIVIALGFLQVVVSGLGAWNSHQNQLELSGQLATAKRLALASAVATKTFDLDDKAQGQLAAAIRSLGTHNRDTKLFLGRRAERSPLR